ncbi:uncharacterized protein V3H82_011772 isoform 2-T3 [Fundulus diaphanus]
MKHDFSDDFTNKFSSVRPMLKEASEIAACQMMRKELLHLLSFECEPIASAGEEVTNLGMRKQSSPYPEEQPFQRRMASDLVESFASCWPKGKARKIMQKKHRRVSERGRTANRQSRKQWKSFHRLCCCILALGLVDVCEASAGNPESTSGLKIDEASTEGSTCFTCMDKDRCPNLITIYAKEDVLVYVRSTAEIPKCSGTPPITKNCSVCWFQSDVIIHCPKNISKFDVEDSNGSTISNIVKGCTARVASSSTEFLPNIIHSTVRSKSQEPSWLSSRPRLLQPCWPPWLQSPLSLFTSDVESIEPQPILLLGEGGRFSFLSSFFPSPSPTSLPASINLF